MTTSDHYHGYQSGDVYNGKLYIPDTYSEVYDPDTNTWSRWPGVLEYTGNSPCFAIWKDKFVLIGGLNTKRDVQIFDHNTGNWSKVSTSAPLDVFGSGCTVLPSGEILLIGGRNYVQGPI